MNFKDGFATGFLVAGLMFNVTFSLLELDTVGHNQVQQAEQKCKNSEWDKIDQGTIYCTDGAEYEIGE